MRSNVTTRTIIAAAASAAVLSGCFSPEVIPVEEYAIRPPAPPAREGGPLPVNIALERIESRAIYRQKGMTLRPAPTECKEYHGARWVASPGSMMNEALLSCLGELCNDVTTMPALYRRPLDFLLSVYIDAFDKVRAPNGWTAVARVKYELIDAHDRSLIASGWCTEVQPVTNRDVLSYVTAQNDNVARICSALAAVLEAETAPAAPRD